MELLLSIVIILAVIILYFLPTIIEYCGGTRWRKSNKKNKKEWKYIQSNKIEDTVIQFSKHWHKTIKKYKFLEILSFKYEIYTPQPNKFILCIYFSCEDIELRTIWINNANSVLKYLSSKDDATIPKWTENRQKELYQIKIYIEKIKIYH